MFQVANCTLTESIMVIVSARPQQKNRSSLFPFWHVAYGKLFCGHLAMAGSKAYKKCNNDNNELRIRRPAVNKVSGWRKSNLFFGTEAVTFQINNIKMAHHRTVKNWMLAMFEKSFSVFFSGVMQFWSERGKMWKFFNDFSSCPSLTIESDADWIFADSSSCPRKANLLCCKGRKRIRMHANLTICWAIFGWDSMRWLMFPDGECLLCTWEGCRVGKYGKRRILMLCAMRRRRT